MVEEEGIANPVRTVGLATLRWPKVGRGLLFTAPLLTAPIHSWTPKVGRGRGFIVPRPGLMPRPLPVTWPRPCPLPPFRTHPSGRISTSK